MEYFFRRQFQRLECPVDFPGTGIGRCQGKWRIAPETRLTPAPAPLYAIAKNEGAISQRWMKSDMALDLGAKFATRLGTVAEYLIGGIPILALLSYIDGERPAPWLQPPPGQHVLHLPDPLPG